METLETMSTTFRQGNQTSLEDKSELLRSMNGDQNDRLNEFAKKWKVCLRNLLKARADSCNPVKKLGMKKEIYLQKEGLEHVSSVQNRNNILRCDKGLESQ